MNSLSLDSLKVGWVQIKTILTGAFLSLVAIASQAAPFNAYPKIDIDSRQIYSLERFPYYDYFVCLKISPSGQPVLNVLDTDQVFRKALKQVAGEAAARQYRYLNELPAKRVYFSNMVSAPSFPQKEQVPFGADERYEYSHQYLKQPKSAYHYDLATLGIYQERFDRGTKRHWLVVGIQFLQRESDWKVAPMSNIGELIILLSLDIKQIQQAADEQQAYQYAQNAAEAYFFAANPDNCHSKQH